MMPTLRRVSVIFSIVSPKASNYTTDDSQFVDWKGLIEDKCDVLRDQPEFFNKSCLTVRNGCKRCIDQNDFQFEHKM